LLASAAKATGRLGREDVLEPQRALGVDVARAGGVNALGQRPPPGLRVLVIVPVEIVPDGVGVHGRRGNRKRRRCHRVATVAAATRWRLEILDPFVEEVTHPVVHPFAVAIGKDDVVVVIAVAAALIDILGDVLDVLARRRTGCCSRRGEKRRPHALVARWKDLGGDDSSEGVHALALTLLVAPPSRWWDPELKRQ
jgi:hypothetical protein